MNTRDRLERILEHTGTTYNSFSKAIGLKRSQNLYDIRDGKVKNFSKGLTSDMVKQYPDLNVTWLISGEGEMLNTKTHSNTEAEPNIPTDYMEQIDKYLKGVNDQEIEITPVFNLHITSDKVSKLSAGKNMPDVLLLNGPFKACDLVIRHTDPAMNLFFKKNCYIGIKRISKESYTKRIIPGKAYVIVMEDYVIERFLHPGPNGTLILKSSNPDLAPDFDIPFDEIVELWLIKACVPIFDVEPV